MNNDNGQLSLDEEEYVTKTESYSTITSGQQPIPPKYDKLETRPQNAQCCMQCNNNNRRKRRRFHWRRLFSYLPSWMKNSVPVGPITGIETVAASKSNPPVQILHAQAHSPIQSGHKQMDKRISEKRGIKTSSCERVLSNYNFDDQSSDHIICCERCKRKGWSVCGRHSYTTETDSKQNTKPIQIGVAETSSHGGSRERTTNRSCACPDRKNKQAQKSLIEINSVTNCCQQCMGKRPSTNSSCRESLLEQAWAYIQSIITDHRSGCPRCSRKQTNANVNASSSNDSSSCKESLLEQARAYLQKITTDHKGDCQRCQKKPSCYNSKETSSYLQTMLDQAWFYLKKLGSDAKSCCEHCKKMGKPVCCIHSSTRDPDINNNNKSFKYPTSPACRCNSNESMQACSPKEYSYPSNDLCHKTCSCAITLPQEPVKPPSRKSLEEGTRCCNYSSHNNSQAVYSGSHQGSCISRSAAEPQKLTSRARTCKIPLDQTFETPDEYRSGQKHSPQSLRHEILGYHSSTQCSGPCQKKNSNDQPKPGLSLTMEPKDHKFCGRPAECKHSKQSLENEETASGSECNDRCSGLCNPNFVPEPPKPPSTPSCVGGCVKCNKRTTATAPMYQEQRMADAEYEAFLDAQYGRMLARDMLDKETICENDCDCMTCIGLIQPPKEHNADPHNYRYYY